MSDTGELKTDSLFVGLTRPEMFLGVSYMFVLVNGLVSILYFINTSDIKVVFVASAVHLAGYIICFKEPLFLEIYILRGQKCTRCKNKFYHGANSYDMY
jgi:type IV secretion system protein VirB3